MTLIQKLAHFTPPDFFTKLGAAADLVISHLLTFSPSWEQQPILSSLLKQRLILLETEEGHCPPLPVSQWEGAEGGRWACQMRY